MSRSSGAEFDPVSADVYGPNRIRLSSGEPSTGSPLHILHTRIKPPRGLFVREQTNLGHANSTNDLAITLRIEGGGDKLTSDMWIMHRGTRYDIKGKLGSSDWTKGEVTYQVTTHNDTVQS